jgi:hypothetical protein
MAYLDLGILKKSKKNAGSLKEAYLKLLFSIGE